jgi:hypothetical protein
MRTAACRYLFLVVILLQAARLPAVDPVPFVRGDANTDGFLSTADLLTIQHWLFAGDSAPTCIDSADVDDDGRVDLCDAIGVGVYLFQMGGCGHNNDPVDYGSAPPAPFPAMGADPTPDEAPYMSCDGFSVTPPVATDDVLRLGDVEATPGGEVEIPIYVMNELPVEAVQLVVKYDPSVLQIGSGPEAITYTGTYYEQFYGKTFHHQHGTGTYFEPITFAHTYAEDGFFTAAIVPDILALGLFQVPGGTETLVAKIRASVSPDVPVGTLIRVDPLDGLDGQGYGPFHLRNELTYKGSGRYPTIAPRTVGGVLRIGVDGDISFFVRGDANGDDRVDVSDSVFVLHFLFVGGPEPRCFDAADTDDDGALFITDAIAILTQLFLGIDKIAPPYPVAGVDPNPDFLKKCEPRS